MLSGTHMLAQRAKLGFKGLNIAARCLIIVQSRPYSNRRAPAVAVAVAAAAAAAAAPAAAGPAAAAAAVQLQAPLPELSFTERPGIWDPDSKLQLKNLTIEELQEWCESMGHDSRKALLLWKAMYQDGRLIRNISDTDAPAAAASAAGVVAGRAGKGTSDLQLSSAFKSVVQQHASLEGGLTLQSVSTARDGTHKLIFALHGGPTSGSVETVLIPMRDKGGQRLRYTACLSSQVGCAMNCQFCYTGRMGLLGNLATAQIVEQLVEARRWLAEYAAHQQQQHLPELQQTHQQQQQLEGDGLQQAGAGLQQSSSSSSSSSSGSHKTKKKATGWQAQPPRINNIVFMGMGEPLHNPAVWPALDILCHPQGLGLSRNKVIVSTVGLVPQLRELRASGKAKLAVSLHATTDEVRDWIVPTNRRYPLDELIGTLKELYPLYLASTETPSDASSSSADSHTATSSNSTDSSSSDSKRTRRPASDDFVVIEYVLLKDVNDTDADAQRLLELLSEVYCMINLIVFNPHEGTAFQKTDETQAKRFQKILQAGGKVCTLRISKGDDEMAACGQLGGASMGLANRPAPILQPPERLRESLPGVAAAVAALRQRQGLGGGDGTGRAREMLLRKRQQGAGPAVAPRQ